MNGIKGGVCRGVTYEREDSDGQPQFARQKSCSEEENSDESKKDSSSEDGFYSSAEESESDETASVPERNKLNFENTNDEQVLKMPTIHNSVVGSCAIQNEKTSSLKAQSEINVTQPKELNPEKRHSVDWNAKNSTEPITQTSSLFSSIKNWLRGSTQNLKTVGLEESVDTKPTQQEPAKSILKPQYFAPLKAEVGTAFGTFKVSPPCTKRLIKFSNSFDTDSESDFDSDESSVPSESFSQLSSSSSHSSETFIAKESQHLTKSVLTNDQACSSCHVTYILRSPEHFQCTNWQKMFKKCPCVKVDCKEIDQDFEADAMVVPGNSFGFLDGEPEIRYTKLFGWDVQNRLRKIICEKYDGELLVGQAVILNLSSCNNYQQETIQTNFNNKLTDVDFTEEVERCKEKSTQVKHQSRDNGFNTKKSKHDAHSHLCEQNSSNEENENEHITKKDDDQSKSLTNKLAHYQIPNEHSLTNDKHEKEDNSTNKVKQSSPGDSENCSASEIKHHTTDDDDDDDNDDDDKDTNNSSDDIKQNFYDDSEDSSASEIQHNSSDFNDGKESDNVTYEVEQNFDGSEDGSASEIQHNSADDDDDKANLTDEIKQNSSYDDHDTSTSDFQNNSTDNEYIVTDEIVRCLTDDGKNTTTECDKPNSADRVRHNEEKFYPEEDCRFEHSKDTQEYLQDFLPKCNETDVDISTEKGKLLSGSTPLLSVNNATTKSDRKFVKYIIYVPIMRVPSSVQDTVNAYLGFRAILRAVKEHNFDSTVKCKIASVICPALCAGIGGMPSGRIAFQVIGIHLNKFMKRASSRFIDEQPTFVFPNELEE